MAPSAETLERFYGFWREWFAQPLEEKMKHRRVRETNSGFYYPPGSESPGYEAKADPKEYCHIKLSHCWGPDAILPRVVWDVFNACEKKADDWLAERGFQEDIVDRCRSTDFVLRVIRYPPTQDGNVGQAHRDFDLLTVSVPGTAPGLEVFRKCDECDGKGGWHYDGECPKCFSEGVSWNKSEKFEVHIGEMLEHYAGAPSTLHRVRTPPNTERFKAVFFYLPPMDFALSPGFTAHDYLLGPNGVLRKAGTA